MNLVINLICICKYEYVAILSIQESTQQTTITSTLLTTKNMNTAATQTTTEKITLNGIGRIFTEIYKHIL